MKPLKSFLFLVPFALSKLALAYEWPKTSLSDVNPLIGSAGPEPNLSGGTKLKSNIIASTNDTAPRHDSLSCSAVWLRTMGCTKPK